jgi:hypothetical protein
MLYDVRKVKSYSLRHITYEMTGIRQLVSANLFEADIVPNLRPGLASIQQAIASLSALGKTFCISLLCTGVSAPKTKQELLRKKVYRYG